MADVKSKYVDMEEVTVLTGEYMEGGMAVILRAGDGEQEVISTNLRAYGLTTDPGEFWVKDYAEHEGLTEALEKADIALALITATFGPYNTKANLMKLLVDARPLNG